ncbi:alkane 1-monooxygenase (plasmid) [Rhodococcus pseudokoreensis]|uniref:Alkane 1-monooxygenase n=1 Tax=Rhodococcus pseudokoreensis TaxID=2811421 RepID=A0A974VYI8_9NOCA|nr:alkane 1-monooxygenase [Rhodococcus pseudokoreensis]QSE87407.1 alkane 1-monooxygenase [Rhodococcus pseudokoreensis]
MDILRYYSVNLLVGVAILGLALGGQWAWLGIAVFPVLLALDVTLPPDLKLRKVRKGAVMDIPLFLHVPLMLVLWGLFLYRLGTWHSGGDVSTADVVAMTASVAWIGVLPNLPINHELMHRRHWFPVALSKLLGTFYLDPNRDVGHKLTHHLDLCTPADSDTPYRGQTMYSFVWQSTYGAYKDGAVTSLRSLRKRDMSVFHYKNALYVEFGLMFGLLALSFLAAGWHGVGVVLIALVAAKLIFEGLNYLQHYGLVRVPGSPIKLHHAWNHLGAVTRPVAVEITNHINHHFDSRHKFFELKPRVDAPQMPSVFLCYVYAFVPPLWFAKIAKPKLQEWDETFASPAEQKLAMDANRRAGWPEWISGVRDVHVETSSRGNRNDLGVRAG